MFSVDVKGKSVPGRWIVKPKRLTDSLYYVLVRLGMQSSNGDRPADRFFILTQDEALALTRHNAKTPELSGFTSTDLRDAENAWLRLPD